MPKEGMEGGLSKIASAVEQQRRGLPSPNQRGGCNAYQEEAEDQKAYQEGHGRQVCRGNAGPEVAFPLQLVIEVVVAAGQEPTAKAHTGNAHDESDEKVASHRQPHLLLPGLRQP